jgi:hypothetical protein
MENATTAPEGQKSLNRPSAHEIYQQVAKNARQELARTSLALTISGLAGGTFMGLRPGDLRSTEILLTIRAEYGGLMLVLRMSTQSSMNPLSGGKRRSAPPKGNVQENHVSFSKILGTFEKR